MKRTTLAPSRPTAAAPAPVVEDALSDPLHDGLRDPLAPAQRALPAGAVVQRFYVECDPADPKRYGTFRDKKSKETVGYKWIGGTRKESEYVESKRATGWWLRNLYVRVPSEQAQDEPEAQAPPPELRPPPEVTSNDEVDAESSGEDVSSAQEQEAPKPSTVLAPPPEVPVILPPSETVVSTPDTVVSTPQVNVSTPVVSTPQPTPRPEVVVSTPQPTPRPEVVVSTPEVTPTPQVDSKTPEVTPKPRKTKVRHQKPVKKAKKSTATAPLVVATPYPVFAGADDAEAALKLAETELKAAIAEAAEDFTRFNLGTGNFHIAGNVVAARQAVAALDVLMTSFSERVDAIEATRGKLAGWLDAEGMEDHFDALVAESALYDKLYPDAKKIEAQLLDGVDTVRGDVELKVDDVTAEAEGAVELATQRGYWATASLAKAHYVKHKADTGFATELEYLQAARALTQKTAGGTISTKVRGDGDTLFFDSATGQFAIRSTAGKIRTLFCPGDGIAYYNRQK